MELDRGYCQTCGKTVRAHNVKKINHWAHLFLSLVTVGLWVTPWVIIALITKPVALCFTCGDKLKPLESKKVVNEAHIPVSVKIRKFIFRLLLFVFFVFAYVQVEQEAWSFSLSFLLVYGFCAVYKIAVKYYEGSRIAGESGPFNLYNYSIGFGAFGAFAWIIIYFIIQGESSSYSYEEEQAYYLTLFVVSFITAVSTFITISVAQVDHKSILLDQEIVQSVIVVISYALTIYCLMNPGFLLTDPSLWITWWAMGLIGLLPILGIFLGILVSSLDLPDLPDLTFSFKFSKQKEDEYFPDFKKFEDFFKKNGCMGLIK